MKTGDRTLRLLALSLILACALATPASAGYLDPVIDFVTARLMVSIEIIGNSIAIVMFIYGAIKYAYTADDPGGRKQAMGICVAAIVALMIIQIADDVIMAIPIS